VIACSMPILVTFLSSVFIFLLSPIVEKMLLAPFAIINLVSHMLQNSESVTRRYSKIESPIVKGF
jgi:hypothetical protein